MSRLLPIGDPYLSPPQNAFAYKKHNPDSYETLEIVKRVCWALVKHFYGLWWGILNTGKIVQMWIWVDGEFKLMLLIYCCISLHLFLLLTARLLGSKNSNSSKTLSWQNGKLHIIPIFVCLLGIILVFIKIVLLLIFPLFYQRLRAFKAKLKWFIWAQGRENWLRYHYFCLVLFCFSLCTLIEII